MLSESTERFDRGEKFDHYREIASLKEYVLVAQDRMQIERFVRSEDETWQMRIFKDEAGEFSLQSVAVSVPIKDIYEGVDFTQNGAIPRVTRGAKDESL